LAWLPAAPLEPPFGGAPWQVVQDVAAGSLPQAGVVFSKWQLTLPQLPREGVALWLKALVLFL